MKTKPLEAYQPGTLLTLQSSWHSSRETWVSPADPKLRRQGLVVFNHMKHSVIHRMTYRDYFINGKNEGEKKSQRRDTWAINIR